MSHMLTKHGYDLESAWDMLMREAEGTHPDEAMYQCIRLVNYIRGKVSQSQCPTCDYSGLDLLRHLSEAGPTHLDVTPDLLRCGSWGENGAGESSLANGLLIPVVDGDMLLTIVPEGPDEPEDVVAEVA